MWPRHTNANLRGYLRSTKQIEYYTHYARGHIKKCSCSQKLVFEHFYFSHPTKKFTDMQFSKIFVQQIKMLDNIYFVFFSCLLGITKSEVCLKILNKMSACRKEIPWTKEKSPYRFWTKILITGHSAMEAKSL